MKKSIPVAVFLTALMVLAIGTLPVVAQPAWSTSGSSTTASAGQTGVQVTFSVTNSGDAAGQAEVTVDNASLPSGWTVTSLSATDPNPQDQFAVINDPPTYIFSDVDSQETVTVTATVDVPTGATMGDYTLNATVNNASSGMQIGTPSAVISVADVGPFEFADSPTVKPGIAGPGASVTLLANVTNAGSATGNTTVQASAPWGATASQMTQDIAPGATEQVSLSLSVPTTAFPGPGDYTIDVSTPDASQTVTLTLDRLAPYLDNQGNVDTPGLTRAINDWRTGQIQTPMLIDVINAWRASTS